MISDKIKSEWIAALESGDYKKGKGYLCKDGAYCCLGVLGELHGQLNPATLGDIRTAKSENNKDVFDNDEYLSPSFLEKIGLDDGVAIVLAEANDDVMSFSFRGVIEIIKSEA